MPKDDKSFQSYLSNYKETLLESDSISLEAYKERKHQEFLSRQDQIQEYIDDNFATLQNEHQDKLQFYRMWHKFLKRSEKYQKTCAWISDAKKKYPLPNRLKKISSENEDDEDYMIFIDHMKFLYAHRPPRTLAQVLILSDIDFQTDRSESSDFFTWALENGFPLGKEQLISYFVFSDVFNKAFQEKKFIALLGMREKAKHDSVRDFAGALNILWEDELMRTKLIAKINPTLTGFKNHLMSKLKKDADRLFLELNIYECTRNHLDDFIIPKIREMIEAKRENNPLYKILRKSGFYDGRQFEYPSVKIPIEDLQKYLLTYDLKREGVDTNFEIGRKTYPRRKLSKETLIRYVQRDHKNAKQIIKNAERGFFATYRELPE